MATPTARHLGRLARAARDLEQKHVLLVEVQRLLDVVQRAGIVAAGEAWMLEQLQGLLNQARDMLDSLQESETTEEATANLGELEDLLADAEWELASQIRTDLAEKERTQRDMVRRYADQIAEWQSHVRELQTALRGARRARAPVVREERQVVRLEALVRQADRALRDGQFEVLTESVDQLEKNEGEPDQLLSEISKKADDTRWFSRQADLLLLQSPVVDQRYQYTVLLRTPSEPGTHGINIQGSSTVVEQDRRLMSDTIGEVTDAVNTGLARRFEFRSRADSSRAPAEDGEAVVRDGDAGEDQGGLGESQGTEGPEELRHLLPADLHDRRLSPAGVSELARDVGDLMYRLFMPEQMQRYLGQTPCSVTITTNDLELPWELMWHRGQFLCLDRPVARMPMGQAFPRIPEQPVRAGEKLRFLLIYADPTGNLPAAGREVEGIRDGLKEVWEDQISIDILNREEAQGRKLNEVLRAGTYDVIHYAGHAAFDEEEPDLSGLLLHDQEVFFAQKIRRLLEGRPLVFLNACQSGRTANEERPQVVEHYLQKPAEGLASSFIYGGALGCIGALWPIYDRPAAEFAIEFYSKVLEGYMIGEAMRRARIRIKEAYPTQITWAAFILYGDPTFRLVD
jgi:hypothetical protein